MSVPACCSNRGVKEKIFKEMIVFPQPSLRGVSYHEKKIGIGLGLFGRILAQPTTQGDNLTMIPDINYVRAEGNLHTYGYISIHTGA